MRFSKVAAALAAALIACSKGGHDAPTDLVVHSGTIYWALDGTTTDVPRADTTVDVLVPDGAGYTVLPTVQEADGVYRLADAPAGRFFVRSKRAGSSRVALIETSAGTLRLGGQILGRADAVKATEAAPLTIELSGLAPWDASDQLELFSPTLDEQKWLSWELPAGAEAGTATSDVTQGVRDLELDALRGDVAVVSQLRTTLASGLPITEAVRFGVVSGVSTPAGQATSFPVALAPPAATRRVRVDLRATAFAAIMDGIAPTVSDTVISAVAYPDPLETKRGPAPLYAYPVLARVEAAEDVDLGTVDVPLPVEGWGAYVEAGVLGAVTLPGDVKFWTMLSWVDRRADATTPALTPPVGPPRALAVEGEPLTGATVAGVGTTPLLTWQAPALGTPTSYRVTVDELPFTTVLSAWTSQRELRIPAGVLEAGKTYMVHVAAWWEPNARADGMITLPVGASSAWAWSFTP